MESPPSSMSADGRPRNTPPSFVSVIWNKRQPPPGLVTAGMGRTLGGRPDDPTLVDGAGRPRWERIRARPEFGGGIAELIGLTHTGTVAVLCAELDPRLCHRSMVIAPAIAAAALPVLDILANGTVAPHQGPLSL